MSPIFVLLWMVFYGPNATATGSQEFVSEATCQAAADAMNKGAYGRVLTICVRK